nr:hypothetical protein BgiMline_013761 [Biomphalaria glabrata]
MRGCVLDIFWIYSSLFTFSVLAQTFIAMKNKLTVTNGLLQRTTFGEHVWTSVSKKVVSTADVLCLQPVQATNLYNVVVTRVANLKRWM